jgi:predicted small secreted protein
VDQQARFQGVSKDLQALGTSVPGVGKDMQTLGTSVPRVGDEERAFGGARAALTQDGPYSLG